MRWVVSVMIEFGSVAPKDAPAGVRWRQDRLARRRPGSSSAVEVANVRTLRLQVQTPILATSPGVESAALLAQARALICA